MSIKKTLVTGMFAVLLLLSGSAVTAYAAENTVAGDTQGQESSAAASKTIVAGAATAEKEAAKADEQDDELSDPSAESSASDTKLVSLGVFKTTGYCPCYQCSEGWGRHTCTGAIASSNHTIAVDPRVIPYGSKIMINGTVYTAEDRGGGVRGNHIDIFYDTHAQTRQHGSRQAEVFLVI